MVDNTHIKEDQHIYGIAVVFVVCFMQYILNKFKYDIMLVNIYFFFVSIEDKCVYIS